MAARKKHNTRSGKHELHKISEYGGLYLIETVYMHHSAGPYYLQTLTNKKAFHKFGNAPSAKPGSQTQLQAQLESMAAFRALKFLFSSDLFEGDKPGGPFVIKAASAAAKKQMTAWKRSDTPFDFAQYLLAVRKDTETRTKKYQQSAPANQLYEPSYRRR